jgi:hypothetical protein
LRQVPVVSATILQVKQEAGVTGWHQGETSAISSGIGRFKHPATGNRLGNHVAFWIKESGIPASIRYQKA